MSAATTTDAANGRQDPRQDPQRDPQPPHGPPQDPQPTPLVRARDLDLRYPGGLLALAGVALELHAGEFVAIVGPSGSGKSSLLRAIAGLTPTSSGELRVAGLTPEHARTRWGRAAFVFQDPTLLPWRSVRDNVALPLELGRSRSTTLDHRAEVDRALTLVGLRDFAELHPDQLSGGMRMRASLARALVTRPELLHSTSPSAPSTSSPANASTTSSSACGSATASPPSPSPTTSPRPSSSPTASWSCRPAPAASPTSKRSSSHARAPRASSTPPSSPPSSPPSAPASRSPHDPRTPPRPV